ncbi:hypothetical protein CIP106467_0677 [Citrobacter europaeus]|nr:hypothetical protein CIP106467_0677 [Citrobacter europaeus]
MFFYSLFMFFNLCDQCGLASLIIRNFLYTRSHFIISLAML